MTGVRRSGAVRELSIVDSGLLWRDEVVLEGEQLYASRRSCLEATRSDGRELFNQWRGVILDDEILVHLQKDTQTPFEDESNTTAVQYISLKSGEHKPKVSVSSEVKGG